MSHKTDPLPIIIEEEKVNQAKEEDKLSQDAKASLTNLSDIEEENRIEAILQGLDKQDDLASNGKGFNTAPL